MKKITTGLLILCASGKLTAQSYIFSQFFSTPLLTNPGNTGYTDGGYRLASNFRSQGSTGGNTYFTGYLSADVGLLRKKLPAGHRLGAGLYLMNDRSQTGALQTNTAGMSVAYHVGLDKAGAHSLGLGVQSTYAQRRIDYSRLTFENQYGPNGYNPALSPGEAFNVDHRSFFDLNTGLVYNANLPDKSFFVGAAVYNVLRHNEALLTEEWKIPVRYTFQAGAQFFLGESAKLYASATTMAQARANQTTLGGAYGLQLTQGERNELLGGVWYRLGDAFIPYLGYQRGGFQVGLSYDYTVANAKPLGQLRNAAELTLLYKTLDKRLLKTLIPWY